MWSKSNSQLMAEGEWEKPGRELPEFELADLSGKNWRLRNLNGKAVLINVWATWCGPCQVELPHIQKLYEKVKSRSDIQLLTINVDENLGVVEPFMRENGYNFPVLPGSGFISNVLASSSNCSGRKEVSAHRTTGKTTPSRNSKRRTWRRSNSSCLLSS